MDQKFCSMLLRFLHPTPTARSLTFPLCFNFKASYSSKCRSGEMGGECFRSKAANFRLCNVSSYTTELLEICADNPEFHMLFIPGNPGVVAFYKEFVESLYELLGGRVSVTAIAHISHSKKDWERRRLFSLQEQIDHKIDFIRQELQNAEVPILLVGHLIGSYICMEMLKRFPEKVIYCIGLYPFLMLNPNSSQQSIIKRVTASSVACIVLSSIVATLGLLPSRASECTVANSVGKSWSRTAIEATCTHLLQYHTMRNVFFMAMTEFKKLSEEPDWAFMRSSQSKLAFLFGADDHWGPLEIAEEISHQVPKISVSVEREGHTHAFSCTEAGSSWVAQHVVSLIKNKISSSNEYTQA